MDLLSVAGAGITIMAGGQAGPVCVSNRRMAALEDLQFVIGEGPCQDAHRSGIPVHAPSFDVATAARWPLFVDRARATGIGAVFAYPCAKVGTKVGVLTLYQDQEGDLTPTQHEFGVAVAEVLTETVLSLQDVAPSGSLAEGLEGVVAYRAQIYKACGMVAVQLNIPVAEAFLRLRALAFANGTRLDMVAADIVARRFRLANDRHTLESEE